MPQGIAHPTFFLGATGMGTFQSPVNTLGLTVQGFQVGYSKPVAPRRLHGRATSKAQTVTPTKTISLTWRLGVNEEFQHDVDLVVATIYSTLAAVEPFLLHVVDDDEADIITTSNAEASGSAVVVEFAEAAVPSWLVVGALVLYEGPGANDEIVVVDAVTPGSPNSFTADLVKTHAASAQPVYRIKASYQECHVEAVQPSVVPLGKGSIALTVKCLGGENLGGSLPS